MMQKRSSIVAVVVLLAMAAPGQAALMLIDDFEGGNSFTGGSIVADPTNPSNSVLSFSSGTIFRNLAAGQQISDGQTGTLFFQALIPGANRDVSIGMSEQDDGTEFSDYLAQVLFVDGTGAAANPTRLEVRNGNGSGGGPTSIVIADPVEGDFYNFWMVMDEAAGRYDVYASGPALPGPTLLADNFGFRNAFDPGAIDRILLKEGGNGAGAILFDNFYIDSTSVNLRNPTIPEPATGALVGIAALALLRRRSHNQACA